MDQPWRHRGAEEGELPKCREKLASQDKEELGVGGGLCVRMWGRPGEVPRRQGCRAASGQGWGNEGPTRMERVGGRGVSSQLECSQGTHMGRGEFTVRFPSRAALLGLRRGVL